MWHHAWSLREILATPFAPHYLACALDPMLHVDVAADVAAALEDAATRENDLILLDVYLPTLARWLRDLSRAASAECPDADARADRA
jgi:hypothetical protein